MPSSYAPRHQRKCNGYCQRGWAILGGRSTSAPNAADAGGAFETVADIGDAGVEVVAAAAADVVVAAAADVVVAVAAAVVGDVAAAAVVGRWSCSCCWPAKRCAGGSG